MGDFFFTYESVCGSFIIPAYCSEHVQTVYIHKYNYVNKPTIAIKWNKNIQDLIGDHLIRDGKVEKKKKLENSQR